MKFLTILLAMTLSLNAQSYWCGYNRDITVAWKTTVDVECTEEINFIVPTTIPASDLILTIENYSSFECEASLHQVDPEQVQVSVSWIPGADLSGCYLYLESVDGQDLGRSELYMSY